MKDNVIDINEFIIKKYVEKLRPEEKSIRKKLDYGYSYDGKIVILYEIRPFWDNPEEIQNIEFAKIRFYKSTKEWNLYWKRASEKWERYKPFPKSTHLDEIIAVINDDNYGCFFG
ncbi:hypothetical protein GGR32_002200 [Mesonia hippocampi]|uniref:DUF3024 domain-containing protein n=1 Tax=Mesonia hippocampi TaxID=1628250 RepID=A0A840END1_9FLAO|nr:DUF3024 domain-containing protein [Mesonia hippocampi]MBB4119889.1 hypothetical protein [Mesonia hippocampi]